MKIFFFIFTNLLTSTLFAADRPPIEKLKLPAGYKISVYAYPVKNARSMTHGPNGIIFVGTRTEGKVYAVLPDKNGDGQSDGVQVVAKGMRMPNGVAYKDGDLYVAEVSQITRFKNIEKNLSKPIKESWGPKFPSEEHHGWKFIAFGPDGWLYVPVGAPCNICHKDENKYALIHRISPDGSKSEIVAKGIRNSVGFDWQPESKDFWFTDNGRDELGDDVPPCELNRLSKMGEHFGFPFCHGGTILDPEYGKGKDCKDYTAPKHLFSAHRAPLGMRFLKQAQLGLKGSILVAEHGSWNRYAAPVGYQVTRVNVFKDKASSSEPFVTGFLQGTRAWGRPVDVLEMADGSVLVSDDVGDALYRITKE